MTKVIINNNTPLLPPPTYKCGSWIKIQKGFEYIGFIAQYESGRFNIFCFDGKMINRLMDGIWGDIPSLIEDYEKSGYTITLIQQVEINIS